MNLYKVINTCKHNNETHIIPDDIVAKNCTPTGIKMQSPDLRVINDYLRENGFLILNNIYPLKENGKLLVEYLTKDMTIIWLIDIDHKFYIDLKRDIKLDSVLDI